MRLITLLTLLLLLPSCGPRDPGGKEEKGLQTLRPSSKEEFDQLIKKTPVVLVDFQATWCGPCKMMAPMIHDLARDYRGRASVVEVDVDAQPELAEEYNISSVPTFLIFRNGEPSQKLLGAVPRIQLVQGLESALGKRRVGD